MISPPRTLIQLHYHDHPGGVTRVMGEYARAFTARYPLQTRNVIICTHDKTGNPSLPPDIVFNYSRMGYRRFHDIATFDTTRFAMFHRLRELILDGDNPWPIVVIGHNLTLGKNLALTAAFTGCVRTLGSDRIRFFSMVHDLAEDGRTDMLEAIEEIEQMGMAIREGMYFRHPYLTYVALNPRTYRALSAAGLPVRQMINPVIAPACVTPSGGDQEMLAHELGRLAMEDGTCFDPSRPTVFYPSRIVPRKNMIEAILIACIINKYNLVTGAPGQSGADRVLHRRLLLFCRKHHLPVVFGFDRVAPLPDGALLPALYAFSQCCISTSLMEGFGFGLYEPWLYDRIVLGRLPVGFINPPGFDSRTFYTSLSVPCRDTRSATGAEDFGCMQSADQLIVIENLLAFPELIGEIRALRDGRVVDGLLDGLTGRRRVGNARAVTTAFGAKAFNAAFEECFLSKMVHTTGTVEISNIIKSL